MIKSFIIVYFILTATPVYASYWCNAGKVKECRKYDSRESCIKKVCTPCTIGKCGIK